MDKAGSMWTEKTAGSGRIEQAEKVREELRDALGSAGVRLPSLSLDPVSCAGQGQGVLVELGRCNVETAVALAAALRRGCLDRPQEARR